MTYCVSVWASTWPSFLNKLAVSQRKVIRCIFYLGKFDSVYDYFSSMKLSKFESIHKYFSLSLIYKTLHFRTNNIFRFVDSFHQTRNNKVDLIFPYFRTALFKNSIICTGPKLFHALSLNTMNLITTNKYFLYKRKIRDYFLESK